MKVIIVGIGKVGYTLAEHLSAEGNDVAVIDKSQETVDRAGDNLDAVSYTHLSGCWPREIK